MSDIGEKSEGKKNLGGAREGAGRKPHAPTEEQRELAQKAAGLGIRYAEIASLIGVNTDTLAKYYSTELALGKAKANMEVGETLYKKAVDGDTVAAIWWSKSQMGWKEAKEEKQEEERPLPTVMIVPAVGTVDQWEAAAAKAQSDLKASVRD